MKRFRSSVYWHSWGYYKMQRLAYWLCLKPSSYSMGAGF